MGEESSRYGTGKSDVRRRIFLGGGNRNGALDARVRVSRFASQAFSISQRTNDRRAKFYYKQAAELGDKRATQRLKGSQSAPMMHPGGLEGVLHRGDGDSLNGSTGKSVKDKDCVIA